MSGMTATPVRIDMKDIRDIFGPEIYSHDLEEALVDRLLTPVDYFIMADEIVDKGELRIPPHLVSIQQLNRVFFARKRDEEIVRTILEKTSDVPNPRIMIFCPSIRHAESFAVRMPGAVVIHSRVPLTERRERIDLYRRGIVSCAVTIDQFNEGVDIPEANVLIFLRSTQSRTVFFQQLGRGLRKVPGKKRVLVLDFVANCERLEMLSKFRKRLQVAEHPRGGPHRTFAVNMSNVVFEERAREVVELLHKVKEGLTKEVLLERLKWFHREYGRAPEKKDLVPAKMMPSEPTYLDRFGSIFVAFELAGIPDSALSPGQLSAKTKEMTDKELLAKLKEFFKKHGRIPNDKDLCPKNGMPSADTYRDRFGGSTTKAILLAGIPETAFTEQQRKYLTAIMSDEDLLEKLREFYKREGRIPTGKDFTSAKRMPSMDIYRERFGLISTALQKAGLPLSGIHKGIVLTRNMTKKQLLECLQKFYKKQGRAPTSDDLSPAKGMPGRNTYIAKFGSLTKALRLAKIPVSASNEQRVKTRFAPNDQILANLEALYNKLGRKPTFSEIDKAKGVPTPEVYIRRFGSLDKALELAKRIAEKSKK